MKDEFDRSRVGGEFAARRPSDELGLVGWLIVRALPSPGE